MDRIDVCARMEKSRASRRRCETLKHKTNVCLWMDTNWDSDTCRRASAERNKWAICTHVRIKLMYARERGCVPSHLATCERWRRALQEWLRMQRSPSIPVLHSQTLVRKYQHRPPGGSLSASKHYGIATATQFLYSRFHFLIAGRRWSISAPKSASRTAGHPLNSRFEF